MEATNPTPVPMPAPPSPSVPPVPMPAAPTPSIPPVPMPTPDPNPAPTPAPGEADKKQTDLLSKAGSGEPTPNPEAITLESLKMPENVQLDTELGKTFLDVINDSSLSKADLAQKLVDMYIGTQAKFMEAQAAAMKAQMEQSNELMRQEDEAWIKEAMNHKEYGGAKWEESQAFIARGRDYLASPELVKFIQENQWGNHPELLAMFYRAGRMVSEDKSFRGNPATPTKNPADIAWGDITKKYFDKE